MACCFGDHRTLVVDLAEPAAPLVVEHAEVVRVEGPRQWLRFRPGDTTAAALIAEIATRAQLADLTIEETGIDEVVRRIYTGP